MPDDTHSVVGCIARRQFLKTGIGAAAATVAVPILSGRAAAHFPNKLEIDIKPGCETNTINPSAEGVIPVTVHYTEFKDENGQTVVFDPTERAVRYRFGAPDTVEQGGGARPVHGGHCEDVDGDGHDDLVLHFPTQKTGFNGNDSTGTLLWERDETGEHGYSGIDSVTIVG